MAQRRWGILIGGAITVAGVTALAVGIFDNLNDHGLDLHFRHLSTIEADTRIVLVDINDHAIETLGDWPWPRRRYAQLVTTLSELGAKTIVLDLVLSEPSRPRTEHAGLGKHYDVDSGLIERGDRAEDPIIYDDDELRDAMMKAGNVYTAMFFRLAPADVDPGAVVGRGLALVREKPGIGVERFREVVETAFPSSSDVVDLRSLYHRVRIMARLEQDFGTDARLLAHELGARDPVDLRVVEEHLPAAKRLVARRAAKRFLDEHPNGTWRAFFETILPDAPFDVLTPDREDLLNAFRSQCSFRALASRSPPLPESLAERIPHAYDLTLPVDKLAEVAQGIGFVSFEREKSGGVVRDIPLLADADGSLLMQLGLLVAVDHLGIDHSRITCEGNHLVLGSGGGRRRLPLNEDGLTLLNWHVPQRARRWQDSFVHIPVARVLEIALSQEAIADNQKRLGLAMAELVESRHAETPAGYPEYVRLVNRRLKLRERQSAETDAEAQLVIERQLEELDSAVQRIEDDAVLWLRRVHGLWQAAEPADDSQRAQREKIAALFARFGEGQLAARLATLNENLSTRTTELLDELRPQIEGKICFVGYTASGVADLVTSPVHSSMPGVMAHANVVNTLLQAQPAGRAPRWLNGLIMLLGGLTITAVACVRGPLWSLSCLVVLAVLVIGVGGVAFWTRTYHIASVSAVVLMCVVWACVTAYRQFTEERSRRQFQRALTQYTSPAVAAQIAGRAGARDLAPRSALVTCFFSDLQAFTQLSERLGARRTRLVLNPYLRTMSDVLVAHDAIINKFMGDGIFAFFNAPIWPCSNPGEQACACALASLAALRDVNREAADLSDGEPLVMRIGLSTGEAFVGDYGSDTKLDYTCIGDTANLASRLEKANKAFGTSVLVDDETRQRAQSRFAFRPLGRLAIPGKQAAVEAHELIGPSEGIDATTRDYVTRFARAIRCYQACEWDSCIEHLEACRKLRGGDGVLRRYREAVEQHWDRPPPADWNKAIELPFS